MPRVGSSKMRMSQLRISHFAIDDLLLVASGEVPQKLLQGRGADVELVDVLSRHLTDLSCLDEIPNWNLS